MEYVHTVAYAFVLTAVVAAEGGLYSSSGGNINKAPVFLRFWAFKRNFILRMQPDLSSFHEDFTLETETLDKITPDLGHIYSGQLVGDPSSRVFGALHSGVFEGSIRSRQGTFYMERSRKLFGGRAEPSFHSLMYSEEDVRMPAMCGLVDDVRTWMDMRAPEHSVSTLLFSVVPYADRNALGGVTQSQTSC
ncbi:hypothetical protein MRX96_024382 [Rhipicephalus microplus]